jgi:F-type H+-transporting ATPase subunit b
MMRPLLPAVLLAVLVVPALAFASGAAAGGMTPMANLLFRIVNFAVLVGGLVYIARKFKLLPMIAGSVEAVRRSLEEAEAAEREARVRLAEAEAKMARLSQEIDRIRATSRVEAENEKQAILTAAGREVEKIRAETRTAMEQELKKVQEELKKEMIASVARMAEEILRREIKPEDQKRLAKGYLDQLEGMSR